ncbi:sphingosine kinase 1 isoform X3 [Bos mutus]|uniref:sphingosine kinase 1 isoform X3 n=1 Tax=Bos mutus TaxID=72004 RepID=UPI0038B49722
MLGSPIRMGSPRPVYTAKLLSDPATAGNDAGAPTAPATGGEGEPHGRHREARLGSTDKELKSGAAAADSVRTAPGTPRQRGEVMDAGAAFPPGCPRCDPQPLVAVPVCVYSGRLPEHAPKALPRAGVVKSARGQGQSPAALLEPRTAAAGPGRRLLHADAHCRALCTERRNHARELVRAEDLRRWDALVVMSGDGLIHEVVNGLMERPDWETAIQKPLCSLPAGSGNAVAASLNYYAGYEQVTKEDLLTNCTQLLCRRLLAPMDLLSLQTACGQRLFSVLSLAWGFIADVDLESEKFRRLGEMRFTLGACLRLVALRTYRGSLAYLPAETLASRRGPSPARAPQDPADTHVVPLEQPVPPHWTVVPEQDFVLVLVLLHSHLASDLFTAPMGRCSAGTMHLFYVRAGVSRAMLLRLFLAMEKGRHMECHCPHLVYVPVVAFRLEPKDGKGVFTVDGELLISEAVQGQVLPNYFWMVSGYREPPPSLKPQPSPRRKSQQMLPPSERP